MKYLSIAFKEFCYPRKLVSNLFQSKIAWWIEPLVFLIICILNAGLVDLASLSYGSDTYIAFSRLTYYLPFVLYTLLQVVIVRKNYCYFLAVIYAFAHMGSLIGNIFFSIIYVLCFFIAYQIGIELSNNVADVVIRYSSWLLYFYLFVVSLFLLFKEHRKLRSLNDRSVNQVAEDINSVL